MKATDRTILIGVALVGIAAAFYFLVLSPKREEASALESDVAALEAEVTEAELAVATGREAKKTFSTNYRKLITLGKAVPVDADTPSLLTQLEELSVDAGVNFRSITLASGASAPAAPAVPAAATEATAAVLPIGATVGPAGLPVMPYELEFDGGFFQIADFFGAVDGMVRATERVTVVDGRLLTIDGFTLSPGSNGLPSLKANVTATSYVTPADQGVTAGASPSGPDPETAAPASTPAPAEEGADPAVSSAVVAN